MSAEAWRPVEGWPYEVSDLGRVRRVNAGRRTAHRGGVLSPGINSHGYPIVHLSNGRARRVLYVHAIVAETFIGPRPAGADINHRDGNKQNPAASNLEYVTARQNIVHAHATGLNPNGLSSRMREIVALQAEVERLRAEVASLRAELARLRGEAA